MRPCLIWVVILGLGRQTGGIVYAVRVALSEEPGVMVIFSWGIWSFGAHNISPVML